jgi:hypothetical protein
MASNSSLEPAFKALDDCEDALRQLDATCCEPGRSPRMKALAETLAEARSGLDGLGHDPVVAEEALHHLEDAGAQIGRLQVTCCAPSRMPLYARQLESLTTAQRTINGALGRGH